MAEDNKEPEEDDYDGPWIEKRIEWKCPDRKRHNVVLFGSWNRFKGGDELEYQGKQVFACNVKLPLGTYVYRFLIDQEEWETHNLHLKLLEMGLNIIKSQYLKILMKTKKRSLMKRKKLKKMKKMVVIPHL